MSVISGIHPVREALNAGRPLDRVIVARGMPGKRIQEIVDLCRKRSVQLRFEDRRQIDRLSEGSVHQGVVAVGAAHQYAELKHLAANARMLVVLDGVEDPHNLGAVIRTVNAAGADGVVIAERRAAGLSETVAKSAAGALSYVPVARVTNITRSLEMLKKSGFWIYGLDERGESSYDEIEYTPPCALVLGAEGKGLHQGVRKCCDFLLQIPMAGEIASLNVSVAAGVALFDWKRRSRP